MNRKVSVCLNDLLNQKPPRKSKVDQIPIVPQNISEISFTVKQKKQKISKILTSDYSNSINKIEFTRQIDDTKNETKKYHKLRDAIKLIHEKFVQSLSEKNNIKEKQSVPQFIRQRDQQRREMQKIISNNRSQSQTSQQKNKTKYEVIFIEILLIISIIYMWSQMIVKFSKK